MWNLPPADSVLHLLQYVALAAQAMTAALAAGRRSMDWVGVCLLGRITALGGGSIRDVLLGHYPLVWVQSPSLLALTGGAAFVTILLARVVDRYEVFRPHRLLFTKLDETGSWGAVLQEAARSAKPLSFFATGQRIPEDLETASKSRLLEAILGGRLCETLSAA